MPASSLYQTLQSAAASAVTRTGIDWETYKVILKTTVAPAIGLAANQATPWSNVFGSLGFIVPMVSIILHPSPPRGVFLRELVNNLAGVGLSAAVTALAIFCVLKAREQSTVHLVGSNGTPYSAVASTVAAIWLIIETYIISAARYNYPSLSWVASACLIFSNYGMVYATQFQDMNEGYKFLRELLWAHLVAFGISTGVALFVLPRSCRQVFLKTVSDCAKEMRAALQTHRRLMEAVVQDSHVPEEVDAARQLHKTRLDALHARLVTQGEDAEKECAWAALTTADLRALARLLEGIFVPLVSLCQTPDVRKASQAPGLSEKVQESGSRRPNEDFRALLTSVIQPYARACSVADLCIEHFETVVLSSGCDTRTKLAAETMGSLEKEIEDVLTQLVDSKVDLLRDSDVQHDNGKQTVSTDGPYETSRGLDTEWLTGTDLHMALYVELLLWALVRRTRALHLWSKNKHDSRMLRQRHLVLPDLTGTQPLTSAIRRLSLLIRGHGVTRRNADRRQNAKESISRRIIVLSADCFRASSRFLASPASGFGLRVTCATMCSAIVCFLPSAQNFYITEHLVWAQYTISFTMQGSAGQSLRTLVFRVAGTAVAACLSWISWYIVVGIPAGVLVFYWISMHVPMYIMATTPRYYGVGTVSAFALTTILGNALQPDETAAAHSTLVLGAIRLAAISTGCLVGALWTVFPFPASDRNGSKERLGVCLASLAEHYTNFSSLVQGRLMEALSCDESLQNSSQNNKHDLGDLHSRSASGCRLHLQSLHSKIKLAKWNFAMADSFPQTLYESACVKMDGLLKQMDLIVFAAQALRDFFATLPLDRQRASSAEPFDRVQYRMDHCDVAALLSLLSHSIRTDISLPPNLQPPVTAQILRGLDAAERLSRQVQSIDDPGAATLALLKVSIGGLRRDLVELCRVIRQIVAQHKLSDRLVWEDEDWC